MQLLRSCFSPESRQYENVLKLGKKIEQIDKHGDKYFDTASVYATMGTSAVLLGRQAEKKGDTKAALAYWKQAAGYNRAFGNALMLYHRTRGLTKKDAEDDRELYK